MPGSASEALLASSTRGDEAPGPAAGRAATGSAESPNMRRAALKTGAERSLRIMRGLRVRGTGESPLVDYRGDRPNPPAARDVFASPRPTPPPRRPGRWKLQLGPGRVALPARSGPYFMTTSFLEDS